MRKLFTISTILTLLLWSQAFAVTIYNAPDGARTGAQMDADSTLAFPLDDQTNDYYGTLATLLDWIELQDATFTGTLDFSGATVTYRSIVNADVNTSAAILQSKLVDVVNADVDASAAIAFSKLATTISDNKEVQDNIRWSFGNDDDDSFFHDATNSWLGLETSAGSTVFWWDLVNKSFNVTAVATPEISGYDSDAGGSERTDQFAGSWMMNMTGTTEASETSDITGHYMDAGTKTAWVTVDGDGSITFDADRPIINAIVTVTDADGFTMSTAQGYGALVYATGAGTIVMPAVAAGMQFSVENHTAEDVDLNPDATGTEDTIRLDGVALDQGDAIRGTDIGDCAVCSYYAADTWSCFTYGYGDEVD